MTARLEALSAPDILAIPLDQPERLFTGNAEAAKREARKLYSMWHPDRRQDSLATEVFKRLQELFAAAEAKLAAGTWEVPGLLQVTSTTGDQFEIRYSRKLAIDVGQMYIGKTVVAFDVTKDNADLVDNAERQLAGLTYANPKMQEEFARYFPTVVKRIETANSTLLVVKKTPDLLLLQDVADHFQGKVPPRHVAWIISRLLSIACYFERQSKVAHNAIALDSVFISPQYHSATVFGGWWFTSGLGQKMIAASQRMALYAPPSVLQKKQGDSRTDIEMIKALGRELLGDVTGVRLNQDPAIPSALSTWLQLSSTQDAVSTFTEWQSRVLIDAFGPRKFVELELTHDMLYPQLGDHHGRK